MKSSFEFVPGEYEIIEQEGTHDVVGPCLIETRLLHGSRHSINGEPSVLYRYPDTKEVFRREWHDHGLPERPNDLPTVVDESFENTLSIWHERGGVGRERGPAKTWTATNGVLVREEYWRHGEPVNRGVFAIERDRNTNEETGRVKVGLGKWNMGDPTPF